MVAGLHVLLMPQSRLLLEHGGCYHCVSRIVDRRFIFNAAEKEFFVSSMRKLEAFLDVRVLTYCVMSNHFHLLVEVPSPEEVERLTLESLRRRLPLLYSGPALAEARAELDRAEAHDASRNGEGKGRSLTSSNMGPWVTQIIARYQARMGNLSAFFRELKWRFSMWFNARDGRTGALWEDRFKSVLVEGDERALMTVAAYIELNAVRAGIVGDPKDYRWCGYGEAVAGKKLARKNLACLHNRMRSWQGDGRGPVDWRMVAAAYRVHLFGQGERRLGDGRTGQGKRSGIDSADVIRVADHERGELPLHQLLQGRVRYFTDGAVIGSADFVDRVFNEHRERFGVKRKSGARRMRGANWNGLSSLRDLRDNVFG